MQHFRISLMLSPSLITLCQHRDKGRRHHCSFPPSCPPSDAKVVDNCTGYSIFNCKLNTTIQLFLQYSPSTLQPTECTLAFHSRRRKFLVEVNFIAISRTFWLWFHMVLKKICSQVNVRKISLLTIFFANISSLSTQLKFLVECMCFSPRLVLRVMVRTCKYDHVQRSSC